MKLPAIAIIISLSILLSACVTSPTYPQSAEDQAAYHTSQARSAIAKGDSTRAAQQIDAAINKPTGGVKIKELFASYPEGREYYLLYLERLIDGLAKPYQVPAAFVMLSNIKSSGVLYEDQVRGLFKRLTKVVTEGNISGLIAFNLGDNIDLFPELKSPLHQKIIVNRAISNLQGNASGGRKISALIDYIKRVGVDSEEGKRIEALLPTMNIRRDELDTVAQVFPKFATARKTELVTAHVNFQVKNGDRLLEEDLIQALQSQVQGVEWVKSDGPKTITLVIERVLNNEKTLPQQSQTITYAQHEVNLLGAVLLMPRNASYIYELVTGGSEIEFGYVVKAITEGKTIYDEVIRGKVSGEYRRCENARIVNVFGGVSNAGFVANADMQRRCTGPSSVSIDDLRKDVFKKIVDGVLQVPPIKEAHERN